MKDEQFQIIGEQEIINRIYFIYKHQKNNLIMDYIFIYLQYLLIIKQNYCLALYYVSKYITSGIKFDFLFKYYLYEIKNLLIKIYILNLVLVVL